MRTLTETTDKVMRHLDDETGDVWPRSLIEDFIQDGYDMLCRDGEPLFDMVMFDRQPYTGNYTRPFEREYMTGPILRQFNFTKESDREYLPPAPYPVPGPANHTAPFEASYFTTQGETATTKTTDQLPDGFTSVERVTHDWLPLRPETARYLREARNIYETEEGGVFTYSMDQDGIFVLRTVGVPVRTVAPEEISGTYGFIRRVTDHGLDTETVIGSYGFIRQIPRHFVTSSQQYGMLRRIVPDGNATRVEFYRLGRDLKKHPFEIPDWAVKYVQWWALHRAYSQPGDGEDRTLAEHYKMRYDMGLSRMRQRVQDIMKERTRAMGTRRLGFRDSYLERFPSDYGYKRPFRR